MLSSGVRFIFVLDINTMNISYDFYVVRKKILCIAFLSFCVLNINYKRNAIVGSESPFGAVSKSNIHLISFITY